MDHDKLTKQIREASEEEMTPIVQSILSDFEKMGDEEVYNALIFFQGQTDTSDGDRVENPFHVLMTELGHNEALFQRMQNYMQTQQSGASNDS